MLPEGQQFAATQRPVLATSPDGGSFVYQTNAGLYRRPIGDLEAHLIPGTEEVAYAPILSPDGQWLAYFSGSGRLKKVAIGGGASMDLCAATLPYGASWTRDHTILFGQTAGIMRVSADGGSSEIIVPARNGERIYGAQLLPGGRAVLFSATNKAGPNRWDEAQVLVEELSSHKRTVVADGGSDPRYLRTGHVVYALRDELYGVRFDADRLQAMGGAVPLVQGIQRPVGVVSAASNYSVSEEGTLVYVAKGTSSNSLIWMNRDGTPGGTLANIPPGPYQGPRLSPDDSRVLVTRSGDIWAYDIASGRSVKVSTDGVSMMGVWGPGGAQIAYSSARSGNLEAWVKSSDGSGEPRQLTTLGGQVHVDAWSADGGRLTLHRHPPEGEVGGLDERVRQNQAEIYMLAMDGANPKPEVFFPGEAGKEGADVLRRSPVCVLRLRLDRTAGNLHPALSETRPADNGIGRWWTRASMGPEWRSVLSQPHRREDVCGVREDGTGADRRHTSAALSGALLRRTDRVSPRAIRRHGGWSALPHDR